MADYKEMYLSLFRASEAAIKLLTQAQKNAEELLIAEDTKKAITAAETEEAVAASVRV